MTSARVGDINVEALVANSSAARVGDVNAEVLVEDHPAARVADINVEVVVGDLPDPPPCSPPSNDNWADARVLTGNSGTVFGNNTCATLEEDEPTASCI